MQIVAKYSDSAMTLIAYLFSKPGIFGDRWKPMIILYDAKVDIGYQ